MLALSQSGASSSGLIGRDASEMSVSPAQNFSKPPPVPEMPTVTWTSGCSSLNSSAAASANGPTVDEPSMAILPLNSPSPEDDEALLALVLPLSSSPHAATPNAISAEAARAPKIFVYLLINPSPMGGTV